MRHKNWKDISGQKFGLLTAIKVSKTRKRHEWWLCQCECGNATEVKKYHLTGGHTRSCGCLSRGKNAPGFSGHEGIYGAYFNRVERNAKKRGIDVEVTPKDLWQQWIKQGGICPYTGIKLTLPKGVTKRDNKNSNLASLDRIDSTKGYVKDNVQWVYKPIQTMKWNLTHNEFVSLCRKVVIHNEH